MMQRHVVFDDEHRRTELAPNPHDERRTPPSRRATTPVGSSREEHHASTASKRAELHDPARARRQVGDELVGVVTEAQEAHELVGLRTLPPFGGA